MAQSFHRATLVAALATAVSLAAVPAVAGERGRNVSVQGPNGRGYVASRTFSREPGAARFSAQRVYNGGASSSRSASAVRTGEGAVRFDRSHTGVAGATQSGWSTIYRTDDGFGRERGASTSSGRGYTANADVSRTEDGVIVERSVTTASGATADRTRTYPR